MALIDLTGFAIAILVIVVGWLINIAVIKRLTSPLVKVCAISVTHMPLLLNVNKLHLMQINIHHGNIRHGLLKWYFSNPCIRAQIV